MNTHSAEQIDKARKHNQNNKSSTIIMASSILLLIIVVVLSICLGRYPITPFGVISSLQRGIVHAGWILGNNVGVANVIEPEWLNNFEDTMVWMVRMPRIIAAVLIGGALSLSGATYQGLFRNPMVSPDILGVSAGASVGACLMMLLNQNYVLIQVGAFVFGIIAVTFSYTLSKAVGKGNSTVLLLVLCGMTVGTTFQALVSIIKYMADIDSQLPEMTYWLMGSLAKVGYRDIAFFSVVFILFTAPILLLRWRLNVLSFSEDEAKMLGVNVTAIRLVCVFCATMLTAAVVSIAGTIGWVGLMIPHLVRFLVGPNTKVLLPISLTTGSIFLLVVDDLCRTLLPNEIPLGVLTSLLGAPFFILILYKQRRVS